MNFKISLLASHNAELQMISENLPASAAGSNLPLQVSTLSGDNSSLAGELLKQRPNLAVASFETLTSSDMVLLENAIRHLPQTALILLSPDRSPEFLLTAMRIGVREIVPTPLKNGELKEALSRHINRLTLSQNHSVSAKTLAFIAAKGGSGATFLATNLAASLAHLGKRTMVIDMNLHFGDAVMFLTENRPTATLADLCKQVDRLDPDFLRAMLMPIEDNLWLLPGADSPERALDVRPAAVERIITLARTEFDFVVLDMGRAIESVGVKALDACESIYIVMQYTVPSLHDTKRLLTLMMSLGYPREKIHLIANRVQKGSDITSDDVQKSLGMLVEHQIPNSWVTAAYSANHGIPVSRHAPRDPISRSLDELAAKINPAEAQVAGSRRFMGGLFGSRSTGKPATKAFPGKPS
jgi:pilus assembly protein CpaE